MRISEVLLVVGFGLLAGCSGDDDSAWYEQEKIRSKNSIQVCLDAGGVLQTQTLCYKNKDDATVCYIEYTRCEFPPQRPVVVNPEAKVER